MPADSYVCQIVFRPLARLLMQMQRVVEINQLSQFSIDVVETARENFVSVTRRSMPSLLRSCVPHS